MTVATADLVEASGSQGAKAPSTSTTTAATAAADPEPSNKKKKNRKNKKKKKKADELSENQQSDGEPKVVEEYDPQFEQELL